MCVLASTAPHKRHDGDSERVAGLCKLVLLVLADPCRAPLEVKGLLDALAQLELVISGQQVRIPRIQVHERSRVGLLPLLACLERAFGHIRVVVFCPLLCDLYRLVPRLKAGARVVGGGVKGWWGGACASSGGQQSSECMSVVEAAPSLLSDGTP